MIFYIAMTKEELYKTASDLPLVPGVYIMYDANGVIIYIGKAVKLRNRVSQYFAPRSDRDYKTLRMVSSVDRFDVIVTRSEMEALILECTLIKQHKPKYNILLKDDKGYPYLFLDSASEYPNLSLKNRRDEPGEYYGPFGGRYLSNSIISTLQKTLKLPNCSKVFPRDIGKERPCLNFHLGVCDGWCSEKMSKDMYLERISLLKQILNGHFSAVSDQLRREMEDAAERLDFEAAAELRDRRNAVLSLKEKQMISSGKNFDTDAVGVFHSETRVCFCILHFIGGILLDKDFDIIEGEYDEELFSTFLSQYYLSREYLPREILLPVQSEDTEILEEILTERKGTTVHILVPERGNKRMLLDLSSKNAEEELERTRTSKDRGVASLRILEELLGLEKIRRIEAFDISHTDGAEIVAGMVVYERGAFKKQAYKRFRIKDLSQQDDYASMRQTLIRRLQDLKDQKEGFEAKPDLMLIDGGSEHASVAENVLSELGLSIPSFGMVKDGRHRTRALIDAKGNEIDISCNQTVFALIGSIQEEVHRYAIRYHRLLRTKKMTRSKLEEIPGIGAARKQKLMEIFRSEAGVRKATLEELARVLPQKCAEAVYDHYHGGKREK